MFGTSYHSKLKSSKEIFNRRAVTNFFFPSFLEFFSNSQGHAVQRGVVQLPLLLSEVSVYVVYKEVHYEAYSFFLLSRFAIHAHIVHVIQFLPGAHN